MLSWDLLEKQRVSEVQSVSLRHFDAWAPLKSYPEARAEPVNGHKRNPSVNTVQRERERVLVYVFQWNP